MDEMLVATGLAVPLLVALTGAIWCLIASSRRERERRQAVRYARDYRVETRFVGGGRPPGHLLRGQGEAVTVAELLREATERGDGIRLNWPMECLDDSGRVGPDEQDHFPTAILPKVEDFGSVDEL